MSLTPIEPPTLPAILARAVAQFPERCAIECGPRRWCFAELDAIVRQVAKAVIARGIGLGDRVAIWCPNVPEWVMAAVGAQIVGAVLVPVNTRLQAAEAADILRRSGSRLLFAAPALDQGPVPELLAGHDLPELLGMVALGEPAPGCQGWDDFLASGDGVPDAELLARIAAVQPDDTMDMLFTSGTTGKPKGVLCSHRQNTRVFESWASTVGLRGDDNYLIINPFFHSFGYKAGWFAALLVGCKILPVKAFSKDTVLQIIQDTRATMLPGAPSLYEMILAHPERAKYDLSSLRLGVTGAASVPVSLVKAMREELGFETVVTAYGLTESCGVVSVCRPDDPPELVASTSGRAIAGVEVKCVDPHTLEALSPGQAGEIWVRGYNVMKGYFEMPEATAAAITPDGWLRTGDIGVLDENGYLRITDRLKDMYIMNGENVYPAEVENAIAGLKGVAQVAVVGVPRQPQGEVGMAFIVRAPGASLDEQQVRDWCAQSLARYKWPMFIRFVDALPMNAAGKVLKNELRQQAGAQSHVR